MKSPAQPFLYLVLILAAMPLYAEQPEAADKLAEQFSIDPYSQSRTEASLESAKPAAGCWSDYLREVYKEESAVDGTSLLATVETEAEK